MDMTAQRPLRLHPRSGRPRCVIEWISQKLITSKMILLYIAFVATLILVVELVILRKI